MYFQSKFKKIQKLIYCDLKISFCFRPKFVLKAKNNLFQIVQKAKKKLNNLRKQTNKTNFIFNSHSQQFN